MNEKLIELLFEGLTQKEISEKLKAEGIEPNSLSIIEKKLKQLRKDYGAKTMFQLAVILSEAKNENQKEKSERWDNLATKVDDLYLVEKDGVHVERDDVDLFVVGEFTAAAMGWLKY